MQWLACLALGYIKLFWKAFCKKFWQKKMEFYFQSNSVMTSLKCPKAKLLSHCLPISQNNIWTIRRDDHTIVPPYYIEDCRILWPSLFHSKFVMLDFFPFFIIMKEETQPTSNKNYYQSFKKGKKIGFSTSFLPYDQDLTLTWPFLPTLPKKSWIIHRSNTLASPAPRVI